MQDVISKAVLPMAPPCHPHTGCITLDSNANCIVNYWMFSVEFSQHSTLMTGLFSLSATYLLWATWTTLQLRQNTKQHKHAKPNGK